MRRRLVGDDALLEFETPPVLRGTDDAQVPRLDLEHVGGEDLSRRRGLLVELLHEDEAFLAADAHEVHNAVPLVFLLVFQIVDEVFLRCGAGAFAGAELEPYGAVVQVG